MSQSRSKKRESDRSGFDHFEDTLVTDRPWKVGADEKDTPPPSRRSLGGEGDVSGDPRANSTFDLTGIATPTSLDNPIVYINSTNGISHSFTNVFMRVSGSLQTIDIAADPQITSGLESDVLTLVCAGSGITLQHGDGLIMANSKTFSMNTGDTITFMYHTGGTAWEETSRGRFF